MRYLPSAYSDASLSISPASSTNVLEQDATYDNELGLDCLQGELFFEQLCSAQFTPSDSVEPHGNKNSTTEHQSNTTYGNRHWSAASTASHFAIPDGRKMQEHENLSNTNAVLPVATSQAVSPRSLGNLHHCACFGLVLQALQALGDCSPLINDRNLRSAAAESAAILEINERNVDCCWIVLRCKSCSSDYNKSPTVLLYTLIKKELLMLEQWLFAGLIQPVNNSSNFNLVGSTQDRHLKIGAAQIVTRRLKDILNELGQTCQMIGCDYTRLAHAFLIENLLLQLESMSEKLNVEINGPCLAIIRSIEDIGIGLGGQHHL